MPSGVVPRWEWRAFVAPDEPLLESLAERAGGSLQHSDETYFVSRAGREAVKLRGGRLDVKQLERTDDRGLQLWRPVLKAAFPVTAAQRDRARRALGLPPAAAPGAGADIDELRHELARAGVREMAVTKARTHLIVDGCPAEVVGLVVDGQDAASVAFESEDPGEVWRAVSGQGLADRVNTSYPAMLRARAFGDRD